MPELTHKTDSKVGHADIDTDREQVPLVPRQDSVSTKASNDSPVSLPGALEKGPNDSDLTPALAAKEVQRTEAALGDAVLRFLRIRKGGPRVDPDAVSVDRGPLFLDALTL